MARQRLVKRIRWWGWIIIVILATVGTYFLWMAWYVLTSAPTAA